MAVACQVTFTDRASTTTKTSQSRQTASTTSRIRTRRRRSGAMTKKRPRMTEEHLEEEVVAAEAAKQTLTMEEVEEPPIQLLKPELRPQRRDPRRGKPESSGNPGSFRVVGLYAFRVVNLEIMLDKMNLLLLNPQFSPRSEVVKGQQRLLP